MNKPIATIEGWDDGEKYTRKVTKLDRWQLQSADSLTFHFDTHEVKLVQDPHSNHLGGYIWLTAIVFCRYLETLLKKRSRHAWVQMDHTKRWVELGSGVGLIGIMLSKLGIENVVITDIEELVPIMERNVEANGLRVKSLSGRRKNEAEETDTVVVEPLLWGDQAAIEHVKSAGEIDYIVACDCIYSEASAKELVVTMEALATENTTILCVSELRNQAAQETFLAEAKETFKIDLLPAAQWQSRTEIQFDETLNFYRLRKKAAEKKRNNKKKV
ncbi:putative methyltransferase-domain-containing protein [Syncephalastrum racemosum]|uniref:Putative methyltransferase-domain-containing protein n=1 Tax=Syncephalastrum racemosum TaxID=13706 RepID=A0A1X2H602_SYNRA|nr:putative methyltransferase-domain-containing protein [Syncephalastrum racemosum]